ncbi:DUF6686 family protein [Ohtaekwangia sp.]|uniref:DUF6686 family protein n=1 Tax=Ohtaekwangia sp. TaxID=2066019 RepID=UPI002FDD575B
MHERSNLEILAESLNGYVSRCLCCHEFNLAYKNVLLVFDEEQLIRFFEWVLSNRQSLDNFHPLPHGRCRIFSSPHSNLLIVYNDEEIDELAGLFAEVQIVLEARRLVNCQKNNP